VEPRKEGGGEETSLL